MPQEQGMRPYYTNLSYALSYPPTPALPPCEGEGFGKGVMVMSLNGLQFQ